MEDIVIGFYTSSLYEMRCEKFAYVPTYPPMRLSDLLRRAQGHLDEAHENNTG